MRGVSKGFRRTSALLVLLAVLMAQGAMAANREGQPDWGDRFERARQFVVMLFARLGGPPGEEDE